LDSKLRIVDHPLVAAKLSVVRASSTGTEEFRRNIQDLSILLLAESSRTWVGSAIEVQTPLQSCVGRALAKPVVLVPILRAGLAMVDGIMRMLPDAKVGHLGLYRDEKTLRPVTYYSRLPDKLADAHVLLLDPMLAAGHSASAAVALLTGAGRTEDSVLVCGRLPARNCAAGAGRFRHRDHHSGRRWRFERPRLHYAGIGRRG